MGRIVEVLGLNSEAASIISEEVSSVVVAEDFFISFFKIIII